MKPRNRKFRGPMISMPWRPLGETKSEIFASLGFANETPPHPASPCWRQGSCFGKATTGKNRGEAALVDARAERVRREAPRFRRAPRWREARSTPAPKVAPFTGKAYTQLK